MPYLIGCQGSKSAPGMLQEEQFAVGLDHSGHFFQSNIWVLEDTHGVCGHNAVEAFVLERQALHISCRDVAEFLS